jgi:hypothetical protein
MVDIENLQNCVQDVRKAILEGDPGPKNPNDYYQLLGRLEASKKKLPPLYLINVFEPYVSELNAISEQDFTRILLYQKYMADIMFDIAHAILQNGEGYNEKATDSFQEVVYDLYDGFLSAEDRKGIKPPDKGAIAPLVKWGNPDDGPYTWPVEMTNEFFKVGTAIVNLPPSNARSGLLAWACLGHETAGHDILHADTGLKEEMAEAVLKALQDEQLGDLLPEYWSYRIDEAASDVLGILNMGPAAGIGMIGWLRGFVAADTGDAKLRNEGPGGDPHPADILRGYLAASTVGLLSFKDASDWVKIIEAETNNDLSTIRLEGVDINAEDAKKSAQIVASTIVRTKMESLENTPLGRIQDWRNRDETIVKKLRSLMTTSSQLPRSYAKGTYAAHVVAAAVMEAISQNADIPLIFERMQSMLKTMHDGNPSWGPLYAVRAGDIIKRSAYYRP